MRLFQMFMYLFLFSDADKESLSRAIGGLSDYLQNICKPVEMTQFFFNFLASVSVCVCFPLGMLYLRETLNLGSMCSRASHLPLYIHPISPCNTYTVAQQCVVGRFFKHLNVPKCNIHSTLCGIPPNASSLNANPTELYQSH